MALLSLLVLAALGLASVCQAYVPADATRYASGMKIPGVNIPPKPEYSILNFTRQWTVNISIALKSDPKNFKPHVCAAKTWGLACNQPPITQKSGHLVKISFARNLTVPAFRSYKGWPVYKVLVRMDIAVLTAFDRGWRKKNGLYPRFGKHVLLTSDDLPADLTTAAGVTEVTFDMDEQDELPSVVLYPEVCAVCTKPDGSLEICQCDRWANYGGNGWNTIETKAIMGVTAGMRAAAIILSVISGALFFVWFAADMAYYKKTGKPLAWYSLFNK